jgi:hypothetical protein
MRTCHAAALALVGWYLMWSPNSGLSVDDQAPLAKWQIVESFDNDCRR